MSRILRVVSTTEDVVDGRIRRRERNAARLYDAAHELLVQNALDDVSVDEICQRAGVGRATFFRIFETKAGLLREFNRRLTLDAVARIEAAGEVDLLTALQLVRAAILDAWRDAGVGHAAMALHFSRPTGDSIHGVHLELLELVRERIELAIAAGEITSAVPSDLAASLAVINLTAAVARSLEDPTVDRDVLSQVLLDQWYAGMTSARLIGVRHNRESPSVR